MYCKAWIKDPPDEGPWHMVPCKGCMGALRLYCKVGNFFLALFCYLKNL